MKLARLGIGNFRSIGSEPAIIDLRRRVTVIVGTNNSGKSNVLAAMEALGQKKGVLATLEPTDVHRRDGTCCPRVLVDFEIEKVGEFPNRSPGDLIRFVKEEGSQNPNWLETPFEEMEFKTFNILMRETLKRWFNGRPDPREYQKAVAEVSENLVRHAMFDFPKVVTIPQHRRIAFGSEYAIDGTGVVELLGKWQHPPIGSDHDIEKFEKVQALLRDLLHLPEVTLEVAHDNKSIIVRRGELRLPLDSYGTGIHQLIILAVAVLSHSSALVQIEEPEVNLHPTLQRELLSFLIGATNNTYVLSTHSNALIEPGADVAVLHVSLVGDTTIPRSVETTQDSLALLKDLGYRASDLLQANSVIWVEGPSDRIYLKKWLAIVDPALREGVHFAVMFYGGRLLSHLSLERGDEHSVEDLIQLLRINQSSAIVIDSDRRRSGGPLNATKARIVDEARRSEVFCWVTSGREIENYLSVEAIAAAYSRLMGGRLQGLKVSRFAALEKCLEAAAGSSWRKKFSYNGAKAARAREIAEHLEEAHISSELREQLDSLASRIREASELCHEA